MKYICTPPKHKYKGSGLLIMAIVSAAIVGLTAVSLAKVNHLAFNGLNSSQIALQALQYADAEASIIKATAYKDLKAHAKTTIQNSNGYESEVSLSNESDYSDTIKQKTATIKIYRTGESQPRSTLNLLKLSVEKQEKEDISKAFLIGQNGNVTFTAPFTIRKVSVFCTTNWKQNGDGSNSGTNNVNISSIGNLSMSISVSKTGSKGHGWQYPGAKSAAKNFNVDIPKGTTIKITTSSTGGWAVENTSVMLILS